MYDKNPNPYFFSGVFEYVDVNGDGLSDISWSYDDAWNGGPDRSCIYLNTGCGWVFATNYTGPCSQLTVQGVVFTWERSDTVGAFLDDVSEELGLLRSQSARPWLARTGAGSREPQVLRFARRDLMLRAAQVGFELRTGDERYPYTGSL